MNPICSAWPIVKGAFGLGMTFVFVAIPPSPFRLHIWCMYCRFLLQQGDTIAQLSGKSGLRKELSSYSGTIDMEVQSAAT